MEKTQETATQEPKIKEQYISSAADTTKMPTQEEILAYRKEQMEKMKAEIPFMEMKAKYNELEIKLYEQGVRLGAIPVTNQEGKITIPGLLGIEIFMNQQELISSYADYKYNMMESMKKQQEQEQSEKKTPENE